MVFGMSLRLVDTDTGEVVDGCPDCARLADLVAEQEEHLAMLNRDLKGYRLRLSAKEKEVAELHGTEPNSQKVIEVLNRWADRMVEEGWWRTRPKFKPGDQRWTAVRGRLREKRTVDECFQVIEGSLLGGRRTKREWVDASSIFRNNENFERHLERYRDPAQTMVHARRELPPELRVPGMVEALCERCDCGHLRIYHLALPETDGAELCRDCDCGGYSTVFTSRSYDR